MARFVALIAILFLVSTTYGYRPNSRNDTDSCLSYVSQWTSLIPKTIDDILKGDIFQIISDITQATTMLNKTKDSCSKFDFFDIGNQTSVDKFQACYNSTEEIVVVFNRLIVDVNAGNVSAIIQDVGALIAAGNNVYAVCNRTLPIFKQLDLIFNFYNSSLCWATHERMVIVVQELVYQIKQGNITGALPYILPSIGQSAETLRQCSIYPNSHFASNYQQNYVYNFLEAVNNNKSQQCYGDILALVDGLLPVLKDIDTRNYFGLISDLRKIYPIVKDALKTCPSTLKKIDFMPYFNQSGLGDFQTCISDVQALGNLIKTVIGDIKAGDFAKVLSEVFELVSLAKQTVKDCTSGGKRIHLQNLLNYYPSSECSEAAFKASDLAKEAREAYHQDKEQFVALLPKWIEAAKNAFNHCHRAPAAF